MAVRAVSGIRSPLCASDTDGAFNSARRMSEEILFDRQAGAIQGQLESSTEFHLQRWFLCFWHRARETSAHA
jgi:hypothetical protein